MAENNKALLVPISLITLGTGWLLTSLGFMPQINWAWTLGVAAVGVLTLVLGGVDKVTVVIGPLFLIASSLSLLRQTGRLALNLEVPVLVIATGILLLVAQLKSIPPPTWLLQSSGDSRGE